MDFTRKHGPLSFELTRSMDQMDMVVVKEDTVFDEPRQFELLAWDRKRNDVLSELTRDSMVLVRGVAPHTLGIRLICQSYAQAVACVGAIVMLHQATSLDAESQVIAADAAIAETHKLLDAKLDGIYSDALDRLASNELEFDNNG